MKTLQEQIAENIEHIFDNTKRIHGNSEALDWIKIAIHRSAEFIYHKYLKAQAEKGIDLNTPFFGNSGAKVPLTEAILIEEINKASLQHAENPEYDIYYTAGYRDAVKDLRLGADQEKEKVPTKELFEKVYIRSEADLPKEEGWYICSGKGQLRKYYWRNGESDIWIISNRIDWYLRPLEAEQPSNNRLQSKDSANNLKTAEEILKDEMPENLWTFICSYPVAYKSEEKLVEWIIDAMQEYAAQFKAEQEKVTDEDIEKEALRRFTSNTGWIDHEKIDGFKRGAKAMRDGLITHNK